MSIKNILKQLEECQTNSLYFEINNDKAKELYKYIKNLEKYQEETFRCWKVVKCPFCERKFSTSQLLAEKRLAELHEKGII